MCFKAIIYVNDVYPAIYGCYSSLPKEDKKEILVIVSILALINVKMLSLMFPLGKAAVTQVIYKYGHF